MMIKKKLITPLSILTVAMLGTTTAKADDLGCKALLCFAGGKGLSECVSTINEVKKRLAKGKGFPHCSMSKGVDTNGNSSFDYSASGKWRRDLGKNNNVCPDGSITNWWRSGKGFSCNAITLTIKGINPDGTDQVQEINF
jgi:hypothetical protein